MEILAAIFCTVLFGTLALGLYHRQVRELSERDSVARYRLGGRSVGELDGRTNRREPLRGFGARTNRVLRSMEDLVARSGLNLSPLMLLLGEAGLLVLGCLLAAVWLQGVLVPVVGLGLACLPLMYLRFLGKRRLKILGHQLPYVLDLLESALQSGHTLLRGLQMAVGNSPEPLASELRIIVDQVRVGVTLPLAIAAMYRRVPVEEIGFLASAVSVQAESGSSLAEILRHVTQSIRYRQRLEDQIRSLTSQSRTSATIVSALPVVVLGAFSLIRGDYARILFTDPLGIKLLETAVVLDLLAFMIMRRIAQVDY